MDSDADGEFDGTDACPATPSGMAVDSAGCSQSQFCAQLSGKGVLAALTCGFSDWRNDEPWDLRPRDCEISLTRVPSWKRQSFECLAR